MQETELKMLLEAELPLVLAQIDKQRKQLVKTIVYIFVFLCLPLVFYGILFFMPYFGSYLRSPFIFQAPYNFYVPLGMLIILAILTHVLITPGILKYRKQFKERIGKVLIQKFVHPSVEYSADEGLSEEVFNLSGLYPLAERFNSEGKFTGRIGAGVVEFSEVTADRERESSAGEEPNWSNLFTGLLFCAELDKQFNSETYVVMINDRGLLHVGNNEAGLKPGRKRVFRKPAYWPSVTLEDFKFSQTFKVLSKDPVEAQHILRPSLTKRILELQKRLKRTIKLSFIKNRFFIAIDYNKKPLGINMGHLKDGLVDQWVPFLFQHKGLFEPKIFGSMKDYNELTNHINDFKIMIDMVENLNAMKPTGPR